MLAAAGAALVAAVAVTLTLANGTATAPGSGATGPGLSSTSPAQPSTGAAALVGTGVTTVADVFGPGCGQLPAGEAPGGVSAMQELPVATAASTNPLLSTLVSAIGQVPGLADTLNSQKAITIYAPYNGAIEEFSTAIGDKAFSELTGDPTRLGALLAYHVAGQRFDAAGLVAAGRTTQLTGGDVIIGGTPDAPTLTSGDGTRAVVLCGNIPTSNATLFVIDKVLRPKA